MKTNRAICFVMVSEKNCFNIDDDCKMLDWNRYIYVYKISNVDLKYAKKK